MWGHQEAHGADGIVPTQGSLDVLPGSILFVQLAGGYGLLSSAAVCLVGWTEYKIDCVHHEGAPLVVKTVHFVLLPDCAEIIHKYIHEGARSFAQASLVQPWCESHCNVVQSLVRIGELVRSAHKRFK
jgi:hypothetical protein